MHVINVQSADISNSSLHFYAKSKGRRTDKWITFSFIMPETSLNIFRGLKKMIANKAREKPIHMYDFK